MANEIKMPQMSDTMHSGKILEWQKSEGDTIARGDILAVVETDKANLEIESFNAGTLLKIAIPAGSVANVGDTIGFIGQPGENIQAPAAEISSSKSSAPESSIPQSSDSKYSPKSAPVPSEASDSTAADKSTHNGSNGFHDSTAPGAAHRTVSDADGDQRIKASPLARRIAGERNINLAAIRGSGPNGRIVKSDVEAASSESSSSREEISNVSNQSTLDSSYRSGPHSRGSTSAVGTSGGTLTPYSKMRDTIARRMQQSVTESPHFYVSTTIEMTEAKRFREALKEESDFKGISFNHLVIKAAAFGLARESRVNRAVRDNQTFEPDQINIGVITAIEDGLLIPVIHEVDKLSLKDLVFEARAAIERVRAGRPSSSDLSGGTFSISNLGMFDVDNFTAIINPGQGAVLAVSSIRDEPVVKNGLVVPGSTMKVTLSVDHRVIDGVMAATFLKHFKQALELPALLLLN